MTTISRVVLLVPRRRQVGVVLKLPRSCLQKAKALAREQFSGEVVWESRDCGKNVTSVGKMCLTIFFLQTSMHLSEAKEHASASQSSTPAGGQSKRQAKLRR